MGLHPAHSAPFPHGHEVTRGVTSRSPGAASLPSSPGLGGCVPPSGHFNAFCSPHLHLPHLLEKMLLHLPTRGAHVRPRTVTPACFRGRTRTPCVPNCLRPPQLPPRCQPRSKPQRLAWGLPPLVHFMSIYNGLCNMLPSFNLTCYKLKPFCVGGGRSSSFSVNKSTVKT